MIYIIICIVDNSLSFLFASVVVVDIMFVIGSTVVDKKWYYVHEYTI